MTPEARFPEYRDEFGLAGPLPATDYGKAFPGTYLLDEDGVVSAKFFNRSLAARESAESVIHSGLGEEEPTDRGGNGDIRISAAYHGGGDNLKKAVVRQLVVRFELAPGLHIYDEPVPEGMVATRGRRRRG